MQDNEDDKVRGNKAVSSDLFNHLFVKLPTPKYHQVADV